ncbi:MAG TPA: MBL fold metallo-hydrolase [Vicinamibacterales bacterium]|nr:MBL fold metallo-hydrolase [Vicinamibacterales bacterium]
MSHFRLGHFTLVPLFDGYFRLDGGAMFGVVPKPLWEKKAPADERNRITLGLRPLVVRTGSVNVIIDAGVGDKMSGREADIYGFDRRRHLDHALADAGLGPGDIDLVIATHLHFDHAGGFTIREGDRVGPRFPRARYVIRRAEWDDATHPHERNRASYLADDFVPLAEAGVVDFVDEDVEILPGIRVERTGGHTMHHQIVRIESDGHEAAFVADLMPTAAHVGLPWIMGYDLHPMDTLAAKRRFLTGAVERGTVVFFEHDPVLPAGIIRETGGRHTVEAVNLG